MYQERNYREWVSTEGLLCTSVTLSESDLCILAPVDVTEPATQYLQEARWTLEKYIGRDGKFLTSLIPHEPLHHAPMIVHRMCEASKLFAVGPMACVAGAIADCVGEQLSKNLDHLVVENGGDIFINTNKTLTFGLFAGNDSPFTGKLRFSVGQKKGRFGVCTSSGTVGHSYSRGKADAVCIIADSATLADAAATAYCNQVQRPGDIQRVLDKAANDSCIQGIIIAFHDQLGIWGCVEIN